MLSTCLEEGAKLNAFYVIYTEVNYVIFLIRNGCDRFNFQTSAESIIRQRIFDSLIFDFVFVDKSIDHWLNLLYLTIFTNLIPCKYVYVLTLFISVTYLFSDIDLLRC